MKHILNNLSEQEKNAIREQHTGGMKVMTENFNKLLGSKLGDSKPLVSEQGLAGNASTGQAKLPVNQRVQSLANYLKQNSFTPAEIQQAQSVLKTPVKPVAPKPQAPTNTYNAPEGGM
jgi:hypothetical protein